MPSRINSTKMPSRITQVSGNSNILTQPREKTISKSNARLADHFVKACKEGDVKKMNACLALEVDINCTDGENHSALYHVVRSSFDSSSEIFDFLVQHQNLDINQVNREEILANAWSYPLDRVRKLCNLPGIDVNAGNPLRRAVIQHKLEVIKIMAENCELDWNSGNQWAGYPITEALNRGYNKVVEYILQQPTLDLNVLRFGGKSVGHCAVEYSILKKFNQCLLPKNVRAITVKCVELLSQDPRVDWNIRDENGDTPIMIALRNKEMEMVRILTRTQGVDLGEFAKMKEGNEYLKEMLQENDRRLSRKVPDCPFSSESRVFQCTEGHLVCGGCRPRVQGCPVCRRKMMGRATGFENFLQELNL